RTTRRTWGRTSGGTTRRTTWRAWGRTWRPSAMATAAAADATAVVVAVARRHHGYGADVPRTAAPPGRDTPAAAPVRGPNGESSLGPESQAVGIRAQEEVGAALRARLLAPPPPTNHHPLGRGVTQPRTDAAHGFFDVACRAREGQPDERSAA